MIGFGPTASADNLFADQRGTRPGRSCERLRKLFIFSAGLLLFVPREGIPGRDVVGERGGCDSNRSGRWDRRIRRPGWRQCLDSRRVEACSQPSSSCPDPRVSLAEVLIDFHNREVSRSTRDAAYDLVTSPQCPVLDEPRRDHQ